MKRRGHAVADEGPQDQQKDGKDIQQEGDHQQGLGVKADDHVVPLCNIQGVSDRDRHFFFAAVGGSATVLGRTGFTGAGPYGFDPGKG